MAFGKKKGDDTGPGMAAEAEDDSLSLFPEAEADEPALETPADSLEPVAEAAAEAPAVEAAAPASDALLSAFQTSESESDDRSVVLDMAGDVELADLLEELNTLSAAIGIARA